MIRRPPLSYADEALRYADEAKRYADEAKGDIAMFLIHEDLARARLQARRGQVDAAGLAARVAAARRWTRRAENADRRARAARDALG